jgi:YHS domain-containing protein
MIRIGFLAVSLSFLAGCGIEPSERTLPLGHPGNPESPGAAWAPPLNPLKGEVPSPAEVAQPLTMDYPLDTCVVSGEKLGSMGKPVIIKHEGREIRFCCGNCVQEFKKDPAKYLKLLDEAEKKRKTGEKAPEKPAEKKDEYHQHDPGEKP